jgi:hypothetical protein
VLLDGPSAEISDEPPAGLITRLPNEDFPVGCQVLQHLASAIGASVLRRVAVPVKEQAVECAQMNLYPQVWLGDPHQVEDEIHDELNKHDAHFVLKFACRAFVARRGSSVWNREGPASLLGIWHRRGCLFGGLGVRPLQTLPLPRRTFGAEAEPAERLRVTPADEGVNDRPGNAARRPLDGSFLDPHRAHPL